MDNFQIIDFDNKEEWSNIADDTVEIYDKWQYVSAFYKNGDGIPYMAYLKGKNGYIYNVFLKRNINEDEKFKNIDLQEQLYDIITPYGYGGVKIKGKISEEERNEFFKQFEKYCIENNIVSEFIRLDPLEDNYKNYEGQDYSIEKNSKTVCVKLKTEEQIWQDMKSTCRNRIRKAIKNGLVVESGFDDKKFEEFKDIYIETMTRDGAMKYYYFNKAFFYDIKENLKNNAIIYTAYLNRKPIDSILVIYSGSNSHYHLGGTLSNYMNLGAHNLTLYSAFIDMQKKGYKKFHLGGGYGGDQSPLLRFKRTFNKENGDLDFYIGKKIYNKKIYDKLVELRRKEENIDITKILYFPLYRG